MKFCAPYRPGYFFFAGFLRHPVTQVTAEVADTYSRHIRLTPCIQGAQQPVVLDVSSNGNTGACPCVLFGEAAMVVLS